MDNAKAIVRTGRDMGVERRGLVIAVATAMQESNLYNLASGVVPESMNHPHQGVGWDHDSVGLFQQRASTGWGPVHQLMDPAYATQQFLAALQRVPGWQQMRADRGGPGRAGLRLPGPLRQAREPRDRGRRRDRARLELTLLPRHRAARPTRGRAARR